MSADTPMYTERERVMAEREAFQTGWWLRHGQKRPHDDGGEAHRAAVQCYPLPKTTRPRVVRGPGKYCYEWRCIEVEGMGMAFEFRSDGTERWSSAQSVDRWLLTPATVRLWADLLANPTEEVEDDA